VNIPLGGLQTAITSCEISFILYSGQFAVKILQSSVVARIKSSNLERNAGKQIKGCCW
jgi:hypothetical protein